MECNMNRDGILLLQIGVGKRLIGTINNNVKIKKPMYVKSINALRFHQIDFWSDVFVYIANGIVKKFGKDAFVDMVAYYFQKYIYIDGYVPEHMRENGENENECQ